MRFVALHIPLILGVKVLHLIVVTQARVLCLIYTPKARGPRVDILGRAQVTVLQPLCNTFTPHIEGSLCGLNVMYHNHNSPGVLQLPWCATTSQWNVVQLPIGMHIITLQLPLVCCNNTRKPIETNCSTTLYIDTPNLPSIMGLSC